MMSTPQSTTDFRLFLQDELLKRCRINSSYSLRAFSRTLQINPSSLSRMLRGEREISPVMQYRLGERLGLNPIELKTFSQASLQKNNKKKKSLGSEGSLTQANFNQLSLDAFSVISDWYHYAILELTYLESFNSSPKWIAKTLGITVSEVHAAVERLSRLGLLKITKKKQWINVRSNTNVVPEMKAVAYRKLQKQVLEKALKALEEVPMERRDQSSMTMAVSTKRLPEAIEKITHFRRELCQFLEQDLKRDDLYQLSISLFPLTQWKDNGGKQK